MDASTNTEESMTRQRHVKPVCKESCPRGSRCIRNAATESNPQSDSPRSTSVLKIFGVKYNIGCCSVAHTPEWFVTRRKPCPK
mmetsp:Transcript_8646/g.18615  ORF Transcript_8646/g.18615 Transcript_8646/m.18615 type:complete len:83 (+) Transcript_8646:350-598(+)